MSAESRGLMRTILERLDQAAAAPDFLLPQPPAGHEESPWPRFGTEHADFEYHALRLVGLRECGGDGWAVVIERVQGQANVDLPEQIARYCYGSHIARIGWSPLEQAPSAELGLFEDDEDDEDDLQRNALLVGPAGPFRLEPSMIDRLDLRPTATAARRGQIERGFVVWIRAYLEAFPEAFWSPFWEDAEQLRELAGFAVADPVVVSGAFAHVTGRITDSRGRSVQPTGAASLAKLPSESETYVSLAEALAWREPSRFVPGQSNTSWRLHAL